MKRKIGKELRTYGLLYLTIIAVFLAGFTVARRVYAERPNYVYDWEDLLTDAEESNIEEYCLAVDANTPAEIVVITLKSFEEPLKVADIDDARAKYFNEYALDGVKGIGKTDKDNGILIIFSMTEGKWGIEIGYGLEGDLTDAESGRIGRDTLVKYLKEGEYETAVYKTVEAISKEIGYGTSVVEISPPSENDDPNLTRYFIFGLVGIGAVVVGWFFIGNWNTNQRQKRRDKQREQERYIDKKVGGINGIIATLQGEIQKLQPKPTVVAECPHCNDQRRTEQLSKRNTEETREGWYWRFILFYLMCLTCGTQFNLKQNERKGESVSGRKQRLILEERERRRREEEERVRRRKREEEEAERRRQRRSSSSYSSRSSSGGFGGGSFGGGMSGGGGSSGNI